MMIANLVGFVIGLDGTKYLLKELVSSWQGESTLVTLLETPHAETELPQGIQFFIVAFVCLFVTVHLMFEYREEEARQGIQRKC
jgi:hypothetical protein